LKGEPLNLVVIRSTRKDCKVKFSAMPEIIAATNRPVAKNVSEKRARVARASASIASSGDTTLAKIRLELGDLAARRA
jgi:hypothetical protein